MTIAGAAAEGPPQRRRVCMTIILAIIFMTAVQQLRYRWTLIRSDLKLRSGD
jgi:hypothetical protein